MSSLASHWWLRLMALMALMAFTFTAPAQGGDSGGPCSNPQVREGRISAVDAAASLIYIDSFGYRLTEQTQLRDKDENPVQPSYFVAPMQVKARFCAQPGTIPGFPVLVSLEEEDAEEVEFTGTINAVNVQARILIVDNRIVLTNERTAFETPTGAPLRISDLRPGMRVEVKAELLSNSTYLASRVRLREFNNTPTNVELKGRIQQILPGAPSTGTTSGTLAAFVVEAFESSSPLSMGKAELRISNATQLVNNAGLPAPVSAFRVGDLVEAYGTIVGGNFIPEAPTPINASRIKLEDDSDEGEIEIEGAIEQISYELRQFVVRGMLVLTNERTVIRSQGQAIEFDQLQRGDQVSVEGEMAGAAGPAVLAREIERRTENEEIEVEFRGVIAAIDDAAQRLNINGRDVFVTTDTVIFGFQGEAIAFADLRVGMFAEVEGVVIPTAIPTPNPPVLALEIRIEDRACVEVRFDGTVRAKTSDTLTVNNRVVRIVPETRFSTPSGEPLTLADVAVGARVYVIACATPNGLVARHVVRGGEAGADCRPNTVLMGMILSIDASNNSLLVGMNGPANTDASVAETRVLTGNDTRIFRDGQGQIAFADLRTSDVIHLVGERQESPAGAPRQVLACVIRVVTPMPPPTVTGRAVGPVQSIDRDASTFTVRERTVLVTNETRFELRRRESENAPFTFADLREGMFVDARGTVGSNGVLTAARVRVQLENTSSTMIRHINGPITAVQAPTQGTPGSITVGTRSIGLTPETRVFGFDEVRLPLSALAEGQLVNVRAVGTTETLVALRVRIAATPLEDVNVTSRTIVAAGATIFVPESAEITSGTTTLELADLTVGDLCRIETQRVASNPADRRLVARSIRVVASSERSRSLPGFNNTGHQTQENRPVLVAEGPNTYGFVAMPFSSFQGEPNQIYRITARISTNVENRASMPTVRLRVNTADFQRAFVYVLEPVGTQGQLPTTAGRDYTFYFVPPAELASVDQVEASFFVSLDLLATQSWVGRNTQIRLDRVSVEPVRLESISVVRELVRDEFGMDSRGWSFGAPNAASGMTPAQAGANESGLALAAADVATHGWWDKVFTGVTLEPGKLYRGRFLVRGATDNPDRMPEFRLRLNAANFECAAVSVVAPTGAKTETARSEARLYDVYLPVPSTLPAGTNVLAAFDILNFSNSFAIDSPITLESFILEEVSVSAE